MWSQRLLLLVLTPISSTLQKIADSLEGDDLPNQIQNYLRNLQGSKPYSVCNVIVDFEDGRCRDIVSSYIKFSKCKKTIAERFDHFIFSDTELSLTIVAIKSLMQFNVKLYELIGSKYFTNRGHYKFVLCFKIEDANELLFMSKRAWKNRLLDFVIMYFNSNLMFASYNPFTEKLEVFNSTLQKKFKEFPDKLKNMNGYPLKIFVLSKTIFPSSTPYNDYTYNFKICLRDYLNATITEVVIEKDLSTADQIQQKIIHEDVEVFPLLEVFTGQSILKKNKDRVMRLYPQTMNNLMVLVPKGKQIPKWRSFLKMFWIHVLPLNILFGVMMSIANKYFLKAKRLDYLSFLAVQLRSPASRFLKEKSPVKTLWLLTCVLNGTLLDLFIFQHIMVTYYENKIVNLEELHKSSLKVYNSDHSLSCNFNTTLVTKTVWHIKIKNNEENAFVGPMETFDKIANWHLNQRRPFKYRVLQEVVQPAYGSFYCKTKSPYLKKLNDLALKVREYGASIKGFANFNNLFVNEPELLPFEKYIGVFVIWSSGVCLSVLVLVAEICVRYGKLP